LLIVLAATLAASFSATFAPVARGIGFDHDDFIVAGQGIGKIQVFDADMTFKGYLDGTFPQVTGLAFDGSGNVIAVGRNLQVRAYDSAGNQIPSLSFSNPNLGVPSNITVAPDGTYYISSQVAGIQRYAPDGTFLPPPLAVSSSIADVMFLPNGTAWASSPQGTSVLDLSTGSLTPVSTVATSMTYSSETNTVFLSHAGSGSLVEAAITGQVLRNFGINPRLSLPSGVVRGPNGDVYCSTLGGIFQWKADRTFVGITPTTGLPGAMLWAGTLVVPEPSTYVLAAIGAIGFLAFSRRRMVAQTPDI
jgi:WD40 repeat protein